MALHAHSEIQKQASRCIVCSKLYEQVLEETTADFLQHRAERGDKVSDRHLKRQAFIAGLQSGVKDFIPLILSQAAACDGIIYSLNIWQHKLKSSRKFPIFISGLKF